jgi:hypothetical protein
MASARLSFVQVWVLIRKFIELVNVQFHTLADGTALNSPGLNFTTLQSGIVQAIDGPRARLMLDTLELMRSDAVSFLITARLLYSDLILELARTSEVNSPAGDDFERAFRDVWLYMHANNKWVRRRLSTFGAPAASGGPTGNGKWYRCTYDTKGYLVESPQADTYTAECIADKTTGASSGQEQFELRGRTAGQDILEQLGLGLSRQLIALSAGNSLLDDGGFEGSFATSGTTLVGEWETDDASKFAEETTTKFRGAKAVKLVTSGGYIRQLLSGINKGAPYFAGIRVKDLETRTGSAILTVGNKTATYTYGQNNNWNDLVLGASGLTIDQNAWPDNWNDGVNYFRFHTDSLGGTGDLFIDEAVFAPMVEFGGLFHMLTAGSTDWKTGTPGDAWTAQDSFSNIGIIQLWTKLLLGRYWPHKPTGSYNVTEPTNVT